VATFKDCVDNPIYSLCRHSDDGIACQSRAIDTQDAMMLVHQCAAGLAHVKSNIRSNEAINLSTAPGSPGAAKTRDDS
jgi:N-acyl-L-homoserine lactone synthetase